MFPFDAVTEGVIVMLHAPAVALPNCIRTHVPPNTLSLTPSCASHVVELGTILMKALSYAAVRRSTVTKATVAATPAWSVVVVVDVTSARDAAVVVSVSVPLVSGKYVPLLSGPAV